MFGIISLKRADWDISFSDTFEVAHGTVMANSLETDAGVAYKLNNLLQNSETGHVYVGGTTFQGNAVFDQNGISINPETGVPRPVFLMNSNTGEKFPVLTITELMRVDDILEVNRWKQSALLGLQMASDYYSLKSAGNAATSSLMKSDSLIRAGAIGYAAYVAPNQAVPLSNLSLGLVSTITSEPKPVEDFILDTGVLGHGAITQGYENIKAWTGSRIQYGHDLDVNSLSSFETQYSNEVWKQLDITEERQFLQNNMNPYQLKLMEIYLKKGKKQ